MSAQMNALDRVITWFSPSTGLARQQDRMRIASLHYDGAKTGRRTGGWIAGSSSGNTVLQGDLVRLRDRSRELCRNNHFAKAAKLQFGARVVGTEIRLQAESNVVQLWDAWGATCSNDGYACHGSLQTKAVEALFESGEVLLKRRWRQSGDVGRPIPLQIQLLESDFLDHNAADLTGAKNIVQGVEFNASGDRSGYWLFREHPGETFRSVRPGQLWGTSELVRASEVSHVYEPERPGMVRGVPRLASVMLRMRDLDDYEDAEITRQKVAACVAGFIKTSDTAVTPLAKTVTRDGVNITMLEPGTVSYLQQGQDIAFSDPKLSSSYSDYKYAIVRDLATGIGIPYELLSADFSRSNYSSSRIGLVAFQQLILQMQWNVVIPLICEPMFRWFREAAQLAGLLPSGPIKHTWAPPEFNLLDRLSEAQADEAEMRNGSLTFPQLAGKKGYDPEEQVRELEKWAPRLRGLIAEEVGA